MSGAGSGGLPPLKPWERAENSGSSSPFKPPSSGSTSEIVEASGTAKTGEIIPRTLANATSNNNALARPLPPRPWEQNYGNSYGSLNNSSYNSGYNSYGGYGGGLFGSNMYNGGYGGYNGGFGSYGGGMYNSGFGIPMGGYGYGGIGPHGNQDPNNPIGPPQAPGFWISLLRVLKGVVDVFGGISVLVDQNTRALHIFMTALLQLFDRSVMLYGELARFVFRILGSRRKIRKNHQTGPNQLTGNSVATGQDYLQGPNDVGGSWDKVWGGTSA